MFNWMIISIALVLFEVLELFLNFTIPFIGLRIILLSLLVLGMAYRMYMTEQAGEKKLL